MSPARRPPSKWLHHRALSPQQSVALIGTVASLKALCTPRCSEASTPHQLEPETKTVDTYGVQHDGNGMLKFSQHPFF